MDGIKTKAGAFSIAIATHSTMTELNKTKLKNLQEPFVHFQIREDGSGWIVASKPYYLFGFVCHLLDHLSEQDVQKFYDGKVFTPAFNWQRISYDFFLTQEGRIRRNFNRETYIRELARLGFTHTADLNNLKSNAKLALKYGLTPGLLCFEPRSVPEKFFENYPMLRGARVDHPFRSFKPRYNMTITHPKLREHYTEMIKKLLVEVPEFGFTWYRLLVRPFVPNVEALHQHQRDYYENFMCTTPHNPNNVDLSRDVLFQLTTPEKSRLDVQRIYQNLWPPLDKAIKTLRTIQKDATQKLNSRNIIHDQLIRLKALRCWFMTQRSVAAWIAGVYGYMNGDNMIEKDKNRKKGSRVDSMICNHRSDSAVKKT